MKKAIGIIILGLGLMLLNSCASGVSGTAQDAYIKSGKIRIGMTYAEFESFMIPSRTDVSHVTWRSRNNYLVICTSNEWSMDCSAHKKGLLLITDVEAAQGKGFVFKGSRLCTVKGVGYLPSPKICGEHKLVQIEDSFIAGLKYTAELDPSFYVTIEWFDKHRSYLVDTSKLTKKEKEEAKAAEEKRRQEQAAANKKEAVQKEKKEKVEIASLIDKAKDTCKDLGFEEGTDKFVDCSLDLYRLEHEVQKQGLALEREKLKAVQGQNFKKKSGTTYRTVGNMTYGSDGTSYKTVGNVTYGSDGSSSRKIGNRTIYSDGSSSRKIGNKTINSDGSSSRKVGNKTIYSSGRSCRTIGSGSNQRTICN